MKKLQNATKNAHRVTLLFVQHSNCQRQALGNNKTLCNDVKKVKGKT